MQARFYLPMYHRFASPDPALDQHFEETQSWNIYSYVQNNPIMSFDPDGMEEKQAGYYWGLAYGYIRANSGNLIDHVVDPSSINRGPGFNSGEQHGTMVALAQAGVETGAGLTATTVGGTAALTGAPVAGVGAIPGVVVGGVGLAATAHAAMVSSTALANLSAGSSGSEGGGKPAGEGAPRPEGPVVKPGQKVGGGGGPISPTVKHSSRKAALDAAQAGSAKGKAPIHHKAKNGQPRHFHSADKNGKPKPKHHDYK